MPVGRHGIGGNAMSRLQIIGRDCAPKSKLPHIPEEIQCNPHGDTAQNISQCQKPSHGNRWACCLPFFKVLFFVGLETFFILVALDHQKNCPAEGLCMIAVICVAFLVIMLEVWTNWVWRKSAPMLKEMDSPEVVNAVIINLEQQAETLRTPVSNLDSRKVIQMEDEFPRLAPNAFESARGRLSSSRPYLANFIFLYILYLCALGFFAWGMFWINAKQTDEQCTRSDLNWFSAFIILHVILVIVRLFMFFRPQGTLCRACVRYQFWKEEDCATAIVVNLNQTGSLPNLKDGPGGDMFRQTTK